MITIFGLGTEFSLALEAARQRGQRVGLVPTMGALHEGHRCLIERARAECDVVAVTIFVNPLQFGDAADIANYPRTLHKDLQLAEEAGAAFAFAPSVEEMYPDGVGSVATVVSVGGISAGFEGASRPGHFDGVATVVTKLFGLAGRCRAYFGEKDFQQLAVVRRLVSDLCLPVEIVGCATVRELDGLALSSRNRRLSPDERAAARVLSAALREGAAAIASGESDPEAVRQLMAAVVATESLVSLDYAEVIDAERFVPAVDLDDPARLRLVIAAEVGPVRLIDNMGVTTPALIAEPPVLVGIVGSAE